MTHPKLAELVVVRTECCRALRIMKSRFEDHLHDVLDLVDARRLADLRERVLERLHLRKEGWGAARKCVNGLCFLSRVLAVMRVRVMSSRRVVGATPDPPGGVATAIQGRDDRPTDLVPSVRPSDRPGDRPPTAPPTEPTFFCMRLSVMWSVAKRKRLRVRSWFSRFSWFRDSRPTWTTQHGRHSKARATRPK